MTPEFDLFFEKIINEYTDKKGKRRESRYWANHIYPNGQPRKVSSLTNYSPSQKTKLGNQQYIGNYFGSKGIRGKNKSEKSPAEIGIAKGLGNRLKIKGTNPKKPGSIVNSKQNEMEIKYNLPNGVSKIGPTGKTQYKFMQKKHDSDQS